jgi:acyl-coenzyme A synthetase/AMP-(fatty) acid ligase
LPANKRYFPTTARQRSEIAHDLPRTATGKVQRNKLRELAQILAAGIA